MTQGSTHNRWLPLARIVWVAFFLLIVGLWVVGTTALIQEPVPDCVQVQCDPIDLNAQDLEIVRELGLPTGFLGGTMTVLFTVTIWNPLFHHRRGHLLASARFLDGFTGLVHPGVFGGHVFYIQ